jgi:hypothetical protein
MNKLQTIEHLIHQHENGFKREPLATKIEQSPQRRTQQIHHQNVIKFSNFEPRHVDKSLSSTKTLEKARRKKKKKKESFVLDKNRTPFPICSVSWARAPPA